MKILLSKPSIIAPLDLGDLKKPNLSQKDGFLLGLCENLKPLPKDTKSYFKTRTNEILFNCALNLQGLVENLKAKFGADKIVLIIGTTTTGVEENFTALKEGGKYDEKLESHANPALFLSDFLGLKSLSFGVSNACTSGAKAIMEGARCVRAGLCEAAIVGGVDSINTLTLQGFKALGIMSDKPSRAFCADREGINIGEAAGLFVLISENALKKCDSKIRAEFKVELSGFASNADAFHITQPSANLEIKKALLDEALAKNAENLSVNLKENCNDKQSAEKGDFSPRKNEAQNDKMDEKISAKNANIDYINAHGTGTKDNDAMEAEFAAKFLPNTLMSSIKPFIGHNLAACGAVELGLCVNLIMQSLERGRAKIPPQIYENIDETFPKELNLAKFGCEKEIKSAISLNFAFGGDNALLFVMAI